MSVIPEEYFSRLQAQKSCLIIYKGEPALDGVLLPFFSLDPPTTPTAFAHVNILLLFTRRLYL